MNKTFNTYQIHTKDKIAPGLSTAHRDVLDDILNLEFISELKANLISRRLIVFLYTPPRCRRPTAHPPKLIYKK